MKDTSEELCFSVIRDFRVKGAPIGYIVVQTNSYYARWEMHDPDAICVHDADANQSEWLTLRIGGWIEWAGSSDTKAPRPVRLANAHELDKQGGSGREWAGFSRPSEKLELIFAEEETATEHHLAFFKDRIELFTTAPGRGRIRRWVCAQGVERRTAIRADVLFNPGPVAHGVCHHPLDKPQYIRLDWFTPPPYCYSFRLVDRSWMSAAIEASVGNMPFTRFCTIPDTTGACAFSVEYDSGPPSGETFQSPPLVFRFGGRNEFDMLARHARGMAADGKVPAVKRTPATWWKSTMACGWHWQSVEAVKSKGDTGELCTQAEYGKMVAAFEKKCIPFSILTIDMFWGKEFGLWEVDTNKWPDLPGFIAAQHRKGRRVLLWVCANVHGLPENELYRVGDQLLLDPLNPSWCSRLARSCTTLFGKGPGCYNADGIKFDFTEIVPRAGVPAQCTRELHGLDYLHALFTAVHDAAKAVRQDVLLDFQVAHPAFAGLYDMSRLNDYFLPERQDVRTMKARAEIAHAVGFGAMVDVDGPASVQYFEKSGEFGNMSLYLCAEHLNDPSLVATIKKSAQRKPGQKEKASDRSRKKKK